MNTVERVSQYGATVSGRAISWAELRACAGQGDAELAAAYGRLLADAEQMAIAQSPLVVAYGRDSTRVWYDVRVETAWGGVPVGWTLRGVRIVARDEGGTLPQPWEARAEAEDIAARIRRVAPDQGVRVEWR